MTLAEFNTIASGNAQMELLKCCHSVEWAKKLEALRPFKELRQILESAGKIWFSLHESDWLEAFEAHPKIGDVNSLKSKFSNTREMAGEEQKGIGSGDRKTLEDLVELNTEYQEKFGFIFIVFATGKSASQMLELLKLRIGNSRDQEIKNAVVEQSKITRLRLEKLFEQ